MKNKKCCAFSTLKRGCHVTYANLKPNWFIKIAIPVVTWSVHLFLVFYTQSDCCFFKKAIRVVKWSRYVIDAIVSQDWFIKIVTRVVTWWRHVIDAIVSQDWFMKIAIPVRTGHVWTSKISFVKGLSPFVHMIIDKIHTFVRLSDIVATERRLGFTFQ